MADLATAAGLGFAADHPAATDVRGRVAVCVVDADFDQLVDVAKAVAKYRERKDLTWVKYPSMCAQFECDRTYRIKIRTCKAISQ